MILLRTCDENDKVQFVTVKNDMFYLECKHFRYQNGEVHINHNCSLGYTKDENGHLIIDEE